MPSSSPPPSPSTSLITQAASPEDEPVIHPFLQRYISHLTDTHATYTRFFSALLIPSPSHAEFLQDLRHFREQPLIIALLAPGTSEKYREVSRKFVGSRFAHPWCRVQNDFNGGWHRASWTGGNAQAGEKVRKEEDRLHRLLVPIWIAMRRRMVPGDEVVRAWVKKDDQRIEEAARVKEEDVKSKGKVGEISSTGLVKTTVYPELGFATRDVMGSSASTASGSAELPDPEQAATASKMLLGVAVTGFIMSDKRVKKYFQKKLKKK